MVKCLYLHVHVYVTALTGYACAAAKILPAAVRAAFLLLPLQLRVAVSSLQLRFKKICRGKEARCGHDY